MWPIDRWQQKANTGERDKQARQRGAYLKQPDDGGYQKGQPDNPHQPQKIKRAILRFQEPASLVPFVSLWVVHLHIVHRFVSSGFPLWIVSYPGQLSALFYIEGRRLSTCYMRRFPRSLTQRHAGQPVGRPASSAISRHPFPFEALEPQPLSRARRAGGWQSRATSPRSAQSPALYPRRYARRPNWDRDCSRPE